MRIVSLLPAATEISFALGLGDDVVGVSPECDFPEAARTLPVMSRALVATEGRTPSETSRIVGERLGSGLSIYEVDEKSLREASPDLILTQGLCDVCAPTADDVRAVAERLPDPPDILSLDPHRLEDVLGDIRRVARITGTEEAAETLVASLRGRLDAVAARATAIVRQPRVLCLEWLDPPFAAGHWVPEMVEIARGEDVFGRPGEKSHRLDDQAIAIAAPDVLVLMPCGYHMDRTRKEAHVVREKGYWRDLPAVRRDRVWLVDGSSYFSRPGPRLVAGLEILAHILHPELFPPFRNSADAQRWVGPW